MIIDKIKEHIAKIEDFKVQTKEELEQLRIQYLGKKGVLNEFFAAFKEVLPKRNLLDRYLMNSNKKQKLKYKKYATF